MGKFSIVEFEDGIKLVPILWIFNDNKKCYWPNYTKQEEINQAIFNEEHPDSKWLSYNVLRKFGTADTYANGVRKLKLAEQFSNIVTSGKDDTEKKLYRRAKRRYCYISDSEEESSINDKDEITCKKISLLPTLSTN